MAFENSSDLDRIFKVHKIDGAYLANYVNEVKQDEDRVKSMFLAQKRLDIINNSFNNDIESTERI